MFYSDVKSAIEIVFVEFFFKVQEFFDVFLFGHFCFRVGGVETALDVDFTTILILLTQRFKFLRAQKQILIIINHPLSWLLNTVLNIVLTVPDDIISYQVMIIHIQVKL